MYRRWGLQSAVYDSHICAVNSKVWISGLLPKFLDVNFTSETCSRLKLEDIGIIKSIERVSGLQGDMDAVRFAMKQAVQYSGVRIKAFIETMARLFGQVPEIMLEHLERLGRVIEAWVTISEELCIWIADTIGLLNTSLSRPTNATRC